MQDDALFCRKSLYFYILDLLVNHKLTDTVLEDFNQQVHTSISFT